MAAALLAAALGVAYALVSAYWGSGGTALLDTVGGALEREARAGSAALLGVVWVTVALKLAAAAVGVLAVARRDRWRRPARLAAWVAAVVLVVYGGVLTVVGVLVEAGTIAASADADERALRWHAFLWDPWFLVWGVALALALRSSRTPAGMTR